ncbi:CheR family methyltransferase [Archaeoglobus veneficus]|uniref:MCP methyltransferase, CheR-type n=1 Tax=Archaeoglobus veneficus (strain DSM 11195 / SNP6) TaxID=693661 RepID=F2KP65_ARCVS|nr:protein-glutamate O-methyltransferase CheR [Archaeoglobus veneficus]AEA47469.1 MCP methyltransferase, CheR-type [Archaeoglobus veneficus SNP6]
MTDVLSFVKNELGLRAYKDSYLMRRINARMIRRGIRDTEEYLKILQEDKEEIRALKDALSINVTAFFRNPEVWQKLKEILEEDDTPIKAWSAACADGREPYSLAMLCEEIGRDIKIIATDIDEDALAAARRGVYEDSSVTNLMKELSFIGNIEKYVEIDGKTFRVKPSIKRKVTFMRHDMIRNAPPASDFDLVLCRNFLIYIEPEYKPKVTENLYLALKKGGILVLGKTESLPVEGYFEAVDRINRIYRRV